MQKLFNTMSLSAFLMSGALVAGTVVLYSRIPSLTKYYMSEMKLEITQIMNKMLPMEVDKAMPEMPKLPTETGPAIPLP
jgi:hypothetical protein